MRSFGIIWVSPKRRRGKDIDTGEATVEAEVDTGEVQLQAGNARDQPCPHLYFGWLSFSELCEKEECLLFDTTKLVAIWYSSPGELILGGRMRSSKKRGLSCGRGTLLTLCPWKNVGFPLSF